MRRLSLFVAVASFAVLFGCSSSTDVVETPAGGTGTTLASDMKVHKNEEGKAVCPVMKVVIDDPAKAVGYIDHEGTRYYMCCDSCLEKGKADPASIAAAAAKS